MGRSAASSSRSRPTAGRPVREMSHGRGAHAVRRRGRYGRISRSAESIECGSRDTPHCLAGRMASVLNPMNDPQRSGWAGASPARPFTGRKGRGQSCRKLSLCGSAGPGPAAAAWQSCAQVAISPCLRPAQGMACLLLCDVCPCRDFVRQSIAPARSPDAQAWDNQPVSLRGEAAGVQRQASRSEPSEGA